jgi:glutamate synthase (NADPH/NADH) large chain
MYVSGFSPLTEVMLSVNSATAMYPARQGSDSGDELESHGKVDVRHLGMVDEELLKGLVEKHARYTGSLQARRILDDWATCRSHFVKIMPHEYRRALTEMAAQKAEKQQLEAV